MRKNYITIDSRLFSLVLSVLAVGLISMGVIGQYGIYFLNWRPDRELVTFFDLNGERNIPAGFSASILFFASILLFIISKLEREKVIQNIKYWRVLAFGFLFLFFDEALQVHERLGSPTGKFLGKENLPSIFSYVWVLPISIIVVLFGLYFVKFLLRIPRKYSLFFLLSGVLYVGGAVVLETLGGYYDKLHGSKNFYSALISIIEEGFEMSGVILFIWALLVFIAENFGEVTFKVQS